MVIVLLILCSGVRVIWIELVYFWILVVCWI